MMDLHVCSNTGCCFQGTTNYTYSDHAVLNNMWVSHDRFMGKWHSLCVSTHLRHDSVSGTAAGLPLLLSLGMHMSV